MKNTDKKKKIILLICNILLIIVMISATWIYSRYISKSQENIKRTDFIRTIESMKTVSQNYLDEEMGYVNDWASYIYEKNMSLEEALDFLRSINTNLNCIVHIVDMDSYEAYSSFYPKGGEQISTYQNYLNDESDARDTFEDIMKSMFTRTDAQFRVLGKYRLKETQSMSVGIGRRVTLWEGDKTRDYLMLRVMPVEVLKKSWVFPTDYSSAEVGIITRTGEYVVQSKSMRSQSFLEYIRGYNYQDDYNKREELRREIKENDSGILEYKNFKGTDCIWYYSSFGGDSELDILGMISKKDIQASMDAWYIIFLVCGILGVLILIDGLYLIGMNHRLREAARLSAQASHAKTQFLSAMSHDIRTPLNAVLGMMMIVKNKADDPEYVVECMDKGMQSGKHLLTLINDVLDISKIESGNITLNPEQVNLSEVIQDLIEMQKRNIAEKHIDLRSDFESIPYKYVYADKMRLNQIYVNLFTNAVKYTELGGRINLCLFEEELSDNPDNVRLIFYVEDNGIGMTEEFQQNMYLNFAREINTQVNSIQGTGLGLSIVKQMVDLMNGTITCESEIGRGTAFTVTVDVPIVKDVKETVLDEKESLGIEGTRLLVAEDNELNWEIFNELVSDKGVICDHAENGKECVEMLKKAPRGTYSAIMMDINMPVMNGYEATKIIRALADDYQNQIPIIAMTADAFAEDVQACMESGMNGHMAKPIDMNILVSYLGRISNGKL